VEERPIRSLLYLTPLSARFSRLVSIGLIAFLVGGAGVAVTAIALTPLGAALEALMGTSRAGDQRRAGTVYAAPNPHKLLPRATPGAPR
jgi:hypothetical protein